MQYIFVRTTLANDDISTSVGIIYCLWFSFYSNVACVWLCVCVSLATICHGSHSHCRRLLYVNTSTESVSSGVLLVLYVQLQLYCKDIVKNCCFFFSAQKRTRTAHLTPTRLNITSRWDVLWWSGWGKLEIMFCQISIFGDISVVGDGDATIREYISAARFCCISNIFKPNIIWNEWCCDGWLHVSHRSTFVHKSNIEWYAHAPHTHTHTITDPQLDWQHRICQRNDEMNSVFGVSVCSFRVPCGDAVTVCDKFEGLP